MIPLSQVLPIAERVIVFAVILFIGWKVYTAGQDRVSAKDLVDLKTQVSASEAKADEWRKNANSSNLQLQIDMQDIRTRINAQHDPVFLRVCPPNVPPVSKSAR